MSAFLSSRRARIVGALVAAYIVVAAVSWQLVPWAVRRALREVPKELPGFDARVSDVRFYPFRLALKVNGFALSQEKLGDLAACDEFYASLQPLDLLRLAVGLRELRFTRLRLIATIAPDGTTALDYLPKPAPAPAVEPSSKKAPFIPRLVVHRFTIERAALALDSRLPRAPQTLTADPIDFTLQNLSTLPDAQGAYQLAARTDRGEVLRWNGRLSVRPERLSGSISGAGVDLSREKTAVPAAPAAIFAGRLDAYTDYELSFIDGVLTASLTGGRLSVRDVLWNMRTSTEPPRGPFALEAGPAIVQFRSPLPLPRGAKATLTVEALVAGTGKIKLEGYAAQNPFTGGAELWVTGLPLAPFSPLAPPPTQVAIDTGTATLDARVTLSSGGAASVDASFSLDEFSLSDLASRRALVKLKRFSIEGARASTKARTTSIDKVRLDQPSLRLFRGRDGRTNLEAALGIVRSSSPAEVAAPEPAPAAAPPASARKARAEAPWLAKLKRFQLTGGRVIVLDEGVAPAFALAVRDVSAELANLSTDGRSTATFATKGFIERAPFSVSGGVRVSSAAVWADARVKTDGVQLTAFSPYSIKVIGYKLDQGALNVDLTESLADRRIDTQNKIVVDQLTLGEKVDSPDALKVPVKLGLAILKDRRGVIDLDVPVAGSLDDPHFRLMPVILKTLVNLIVKAATSPFDALSKMMGGGADLGHVAFAPGVSVLAPDAAANLDKVAQVLADRPALSIGVRGAAAKPDALAFGDAALRRRLRGSNPGEAPLSPSEEKKVRSLFEKTFGGAAASLQEARAKLDERLVPSDADLRAL
ncbi:MAG: DUF748 domain-containing protein, partial [Elusimicrobiota bacterium]